MRPAMFADLEFAAALEYTTARRELLLVDATATWCGPCQIMDRTTWVDPDAVAWFRHSGLAIQIDVDKQKEVARRLGIEATPKIIAFVGGKELDRALGALKPRQLL